MIFNVITLMPEMLTEGLSFGVVGKAFNKNICRLNLVNPREFTQDVHQTVDDRPFGGGDGMLMMAEPLQQSLLSLKEPGEVYFLSPQGPVLDESIVNEMSQQKAMTLICGRYGGVDQRFLTKNKIREISIGDYVLSGGELAAQVIIDAVTRKLPNVLGHSDSASHDSFASGLLEAPHFTRPRQWQECEVPSILLSGDHRKIEEYKTWMALCITLLKRPELLDGESIQWQKALDYIEGLDESVLVANGFDVMDIKQKLKERLK